MPESQKAFAPKIKIFGVGGGAGKAITVLKCGNFNGAELIIGNTDICALQGETADLRIQLGEKTAKGLGAGADPDRGRAAAEESIEEIRHALKGSDLAIILACLGGGTGTGSAPVVAQAARELGPFTVGVATMPFAFEGRRTTQAETGWRQFKTQVDTILTIPYESFFSRYQPKQRFIDMMAFADQVIGLAIKGIIGQATQDQGGDDHFSAYKKMTRNKMWILLGVWTASGENRAIAAACQALGGPFIENNALVEAREIHLHIFGQRDLSEREIETITAAISECAKGTARINAWMFHDDCLVEEIRVLIYSASGK